MEVVPSNSNDPFHFNHAPYLSAPSSPKRFGQLYYLSAPSSPSRLSAQFDSPYHIHNQGDDDFAFFVTADSDSPRSAEELFQAGKIKPLKEKEKEDLSESAKSPLLPRARPKRSSKREEEEEERRGREGKVKGTSLSSSRSRVTRSLSPTSRISNSIWEEEPSKEEPSKSGRKWRLRDFLLFRSASEGRASTIDPLTKFPSFYKKPQDPKTSTAPRPKTSRKEPLSPHELHYARKKAETQDLKKKTFLPYKQGILGRFPGFRFK